MSAAAAAACAPMRLGAMSLTFPAPVPEAGRGAAGSETKPEGREVHRELWQACAGSLCAVPPVGAAVYYFPQGHAEQAGAGAAVDAVLRRAGVRPLVACRVAAVALLAEPDTDDVYARIRLVPLRHGEPVADLVVGDSGGDAQQQQRRPGPLSSAKMLTTSDANNGSGLSVPRFCAEKVFPALDHSVYPPVQFLTARDVHGAEWTFRHIFRGTPRRHLLTTGWSHFVNRKRLQPNDSVVFLRDDDGSLHIGLRRASRVFRGGGGGDDGDGKVPAEDVVAAARLAAAGLPFEVVHYPRGSAPEFCVRADVVKESMQVPWCPGLPFKMPFETEDLSRISWYMGTVAAVEAADPARWPQSPWRLLQVIWEEPEILHNVNRVCPWQVELVSSMPTLPRFSPPPRKKPRTPPPPYTESSHSEYRLLFDPAFPPNHRPLALAPPPHPAGPTHDRNRHGFVPSFPFPDSIAAAAVAAAGIQGARHPQFAPFFSDLHLSSLQQSLLFCGIRPAAADHQALPPAPRITTDLSIGSPTPRSSSSEAKKGDDAKPPGIMLFGRAVLTEEQMKSSNSSTRSGSSNPDCDDEKASNTSSSDGTHGSPAKKNSPSLTLQCKVFVESDAVGKNLDLSALGSFEELCARLSGMFGIDNADLRSHMVYRTIAGEVKHVGDEPFSAFVKSARRITILSDAGN